MKNWGAGKKSNSNRELLQRLARLEEIVLRRGGEDFSIVNGSVKSVAPAVSQDTESERLELECLSLGASCSIEVVFYMKLQ